MLIPAPISLPSLQFSSSWSLLSQLHPFLSQTPNGYLLQESLDNSLIFQMRRDYVTNRRFTDLDTFGLIGLSRINPHQTQCYITEGVSDFMALSLLLPNSNVLGVTNIGGSTNARKILISLFDHITIIADNDLPGSVAASKWQSLFSQFNIKSRVWTSDVGKDLCDKFLFNYKLDPTCIQF